MDTGALTRETKTDARGESAQPQLVLVLERGRPLSGGARHSLANIDRVTIGRGVARTAARRMIDGVRTLVLTVPDGRMSTAHATIAKKAGVWTFDDRGSTNGSRIDRRRVEAEILTDGALLEAAGTFFRFRAAVPTPSTAEGDVDSTRLTGLVAAFGTVLPRLTADLERLGHVAASDVSVLLLGESGTGKEVLARGIHEASPRKGGPWVAVNCGAIPAGLVEATLFGHKKGAFSGATADELGLVRAAHGGTLFLDEIGDLPRASQASLLRVLQEGEVLPVGATRPIAADVRVVAATHKPLAALVESGEFRRDLHARLSAFTFALPPLRERMDDLGVLVAALLGRIDPTGAASLVLGSEMAHALLAHSWKNNVRELEQCLRLSRLLAVGKRMDEARLPETQAPRSAPARVTRALTAEEERQRAELLAMLAACGGNVTKTGEAMGKARSQIQRWMKRFAIDASEWG